MTLSRPILKDSAVCRIAVILLFLVGLLFMPIRAFAEAPSLTVLVYHYIRITPGDPAEGETVISYEHFAEEMRYLHDHGYTTLSMDEAVAFLKGKKFPRKTVALQFDDGLAAGLYAMPLLDLYGFKATYWIIPPSIGTGPHFMNWAMVQDIDKNPRYKVYSHTQTHPVEPGGTMVDWVEGRTDGKGAKDALFELTESKRILEEKLGHPIPYLAWPRGAFNDALIDMAKQAGYTATATTLDKPNHPGGDPLRIHRVIVNGACDEKTFEAIVADGVYRACGT